MLGGTVQYSTVSTKPLFHFPFFRASIHPPSFPQKKKPSLFKKNRLKKKTPQLSPPKSSRSRHHLRFPTTTALVIRIPDLWRIPLDPTVVARRNSVARPPPGNIHHAAVAVVVAGGVGAWVVLFDEGWRDVQDASLFLVFAEAVVVVLVGGVSGSFPLFSFWGREGKGREREGEEEIGLVLTGG